MKTVKVELGQRSYPIYIGDNLLNQSGLFQKHINSQQILIITNEIVAPHYLESVRQHFHASDHDVLILPDGEQTKSLANLELIMTRLLEKKYSRSCLLIALGGGVIGDLVGFAAACYQRGVKFIQIPTTLLAQVDSSVGGKTAVDHALGKNMIGAFYQPQAVIADSSVLGTLPDKQLSAGLAEIIKYGLIRDKDFFHWLENNINQLVNRDEDALVYAIERSCINKAEVVAQDEREDGLRAILNLGHTFGHAIETGLSYQHWLHGEAVGCGMLMAADLSIRQGLLATDRLDRIRELLQLASLPTKMHQDITTKQMLENMKVDKKAKEGVVYLILLKEIGEAIISADYSMNHLLETVQHYLNHG